MNTRTRFRGWFFTALLGLASCLNTAPGHAAIITNVEVGDIFYAPISVSIHTGDKVRWFWTGQISHSVTSDTGLWNNTGLKGNGFTFTNTFNTKGSFPYHCTLHGQQRGSVIVQAAAAGSPPTVTITSPTNGQVMTAPASLTLAATATDSDGSVTNVEFFQGNASLGKVSVSPYSVPVNNLGAGNYTFSAVATDNTGLKGTNSVDLTVNAILSNAPPVAAIVSPVDGSTLVAPWTGTILATASDPDGTVAKVEFFADNTSLGTVLNPSAQISFPVTNLAAGTYVLTAKATDNGGASVTSAGVTIHVIATTGVTLSAPAKSSASVFQFSYTASPGLTYVVLRSADLTSWQPISTNLATTNLVLFQDSLATSSLGYYRVGLLANP